MIVMNVSSLAWFFAHEKGFLPQEIQSFLPEIPEELRGDWGGAEIALISEEAAGDSRVGGYADDLHTAARDQRQTQRAHAITLLWAEAQGMKLNPGKSVSFGPGQLRIRGEVLQNVETVTLLGDCLRARQEDAPAALHMDDKKSPRVPSKT